MYAQLNVNSTFSEFDQIEPFKFLGVMFEYLFLVREELLVGVHMLATFSYR